MNHVVKIIIVAASLLASTAFAQDIPNFDSMNHEQRREAMQKMTPEQRESFHNARKEQWQGMSKEEKLKAVEERRAGYIKEREAEWKSLSDDEKIERAEKMMEKKARYSGHKNDKAPAAADEGAKP